MLNPKSTPRELIIFAKAPISGISKTRLAKDIGSANAARVARMLLRRTLKTTGNDARWDSTLCITPPAHIKKYDTIFWPAGYSKRAQAKADLGAKLYHAFKEARGRHCVIIGTDCPDLSRHDIAQAFKNLKRHDLVIGPAQDGGFYLIAIAQHQLGRRFFDNIRWSTEFALADLLRNIPNSFKVHKLRQLSDIDTGPDYAAWLGSAQV